MGSGAGGATRHAVTAWWGLVLGGLGVFVLHTLVPLAPPATAAAVFDGWLYTALLVAASLGTLARGLLVPADRVAWLLIGAGCLSWTLGDVYWWRVLSMRDEVPAPSPSDALYIAFYPLVYAGLVLLVRRRVRHFHASQWLDGVAAAACVAAIAAAMVWPRLSPGAGGDVGAVATNLAYPLGDALILVLVAGILVLAAGGPGSAWGLLGLGCAVFAAGDTAYLLRVASDDYVEGTLIDAAWPAALVLIGIAAWQPSREAGLARLDGWRVLFVPATVTGLSLALLVRDHYVPGNALVVWCAPARSRSPWCGRVSPSARTSPLPTATGRRPPTRSPGCRTGGCSWTARARPCCSRAAPALRWR